jgi:hypothetical protein
MTNLTEDHQAEALAAEIMAGSTNGQASRPPAANAAEQLADQMVDEYRRFKGANT